MATLKGTIGPDGKATYDGVPDVTARRFPLGQRETGQTLPKVGETPNPKVAVRKETDPAGQY